MSTQRWRLVSGFVVLALVGCGIYGCNAREKKFTFECSGPSKNVTIKFSKDDIPAPNTGTLVCAKDTLQWESDVDFKIEFENTDCFDQQIYPSSGHKTAQTLPIRNPASGSTTSPIGVCKYSIWVGSVRHDPHVIIMQ
ncbi:MAG: hypothetical protein WBQ10_17925 [Terriglobales bacterium]